MKEYNILCVSGGGVKICAYIGVLKKMEEIIRQRKMMESKGIECNLPILNFKTICAVSAGCIFSLAYILGYNYIELLEDILMIDFRKLKNIQLSNLYSKFGIDTGNNVMNWVKTIMKKKKCNVEINFLELYKKTNIDFQVMTTNLNNYSYKKFNYIDTPNFKVIDAIRMSISIPLIYTVKKYNNEFYVDGGVISNYPIIMFKDNLTNVLGIKFTNDTKTNIHNLESYIYNVFNCYMLKKDNSICKIDDINKCTVYIKTKTSAMNFNLKAREKYKLVQEGYNSINYFLEKNNFI